MEGVLRSMNAPVWIDKEKFLSEYHRELRSWKNLINEGLKCNVSAEELVRDDERHHGRALGFLVALNCLPLSVISDDEIQTLRKELCDARDWCDAQINIYAEV